ncbi:hypothetical protein LXN10_13965 [Arcobacter sp. KX21116]|uniref:hypothetical protein n=1 Tax=Arcobacter iocasae TaxID=2906515 RepID=UPI0035D4F5E8
MIDTTSMGIMASYVQPSSSTMATRMISQKDDNSDSTLNIDELGIDSNIFSSYDSNTDGLVNKAELSSAIDSAMSKFNGNIPSKEEFQSLLSEFGFEVQNSSNSNNLSSTQSDTISSILENYDADNLTQSDAKEIVAAFKESGIEPGKELESAMEEAGFDAREVGTLAGVGPQEASGGGGSGGGQGSESSSEEEYDIMDTNEDGVVSLDEIEEYYGTNTDTSTDSSTETLNQNNQNALDNLQLLMETLKVSTEDDSIDTNNFNGLLKAINNQNNNSKINAYLQTDNTSSLSGYV